MARDDKDLGARLRALRTAAENANGRVDPEVVAPALQVVERAGRRLEVSGDATVVAIGGATGSGKSSTFNAVSGTELADPGIRRPTTSKAMAVTFGADSADDLIEFLQIPNRHSLEPGDTYAEGLEGLVLIDLPDHDSTEVAHRQEVDRLVPLVDMLVWIVDPQKYADAALHDRYLKPLAAYADVMMVVLNQADRLEGVSRDQALRDLRRLLDSEGLAKAEIAAVSAKTGEGIPELRQRLIKRAADKKMTARRLEVDVKEAATALARESGTKQADRASKEAVRRLNGTLATAAGVPVVSEAVGKAWRHRGALATGWPVLSWLGRFRPDPLRSLHLDRLGVGGGRKEIDPARVSRTSLPAATSVQKARVDSAVRDLADEVSTGMPKGWAEAVRGASKANDAYITDQLDRAIATTDLGLDRGRGWWRAVTVLQWLFFLTAVAGLVWLGVAFAMLYLQMPPLPDITWWGVPAPLVLLVGGALAGVLLAILARVGVEVGARTKQREARQALIDSIAGVTEERILRPVNAEVDRYELVRENLARALR
ncbi:50S ribosome-binding GTPase [Mariniluteicoccus endophyticus]